MKNCLKCKKKVYDSTKLVLNKHLEHINNWTICNECNTKDTYASDYYYDNKEQYRKLHKKYKAELTDSYVANALVDGTNLKAKDMPQELIDAKRQYMKLNRIMKENS